MKAGKIGFVFPGQGSQVLKMGQELHNTYSEVKHIFQEIDDAINFKISNIMFGENLEELTKTENAQVAIMAVSISCLKVLEKESGMPIKTYASSLAGHSLGEYSALCAAGAISLKDTAIILRKRGQFMASCMPTGGSMLAIIGLDEAKVNELTNGETLVIANDNAVGQIVLSGTEHEIEKALIKAKEMGAKMAIKLQVSGPFHSPLLLKASKQMEEALLEIEIKMPEIQVINNVNVENYTSVQEIRTILSRQVISKVRWRETMLKMEAENIKTVIELGSGKVLSGLFKRTAKSINCLNAENTAEILNIVNLLKAE